MANGIDDAVWDWLKEFQRDIQKRFDGLDCKTHDRQLVSDDARLKSLEKARANNNVDRRDKKIWRRRIVVTLIVLFIGGEIFGFLGSMKLATLNWLGIEHHQTETGAIVIDVETKNE